MRIALVNVKQETNTFNPQPTTLADYRAFGIYEGRDVLDSMRGYGEIGGYLEAVEQSGLDVETVPVFRARSGAGGRITAEARRYFLDRIRAGLTAAGKVDALAIQLHGACAAEDEDDVEGEQVALCREILGPDVPIVLSLDHHANVTRKIMASVTAIVGHRTQPHDPFDTGKVAAQLLLRILTDKLKPVMAWRKIPLLSHQEQFLTAKPPMKLWFDRARAMEADPRVLQVAPFPMQPWLDVAEGGWAAVVTTNGEPDLGERLADEMGDLAWSLRAEFQKKDSIPVDEAARRADATEKGVVSLSDTGDTVAGGAAGDSNLILEAILRLGIKSKALIPMIAPETVARLIEAGVGATVTLPVGGQASGFFKPLTVTGTVRSITTSGKVDLSQHSTHQPQIDMGRVVVFDVGPVTMLISELRGVGGNVPAVYRTFGIEPTEYKMAVLKTASNFQYFAPISSRLIRIDTSGPGQSDIAGLTWKRLPRPIYPLDDITSWKAAGNGTTIRRSVA